MKPFLNKYIYPPLYGLLVYFTIRLVVDTIAQFKFWQRPWHTNAIEIVGSAAVGYLFLWAIERTEKKYNADVQTDFKLRNVVREFRTVLFYNLLIINLIIVPMAAVTDNGLQLFDFITINLIPGFYVMLLFMFRRANYYLKAFVQHKIQLEKVTQEQLKSEMEFLKGQFHPHFLFNALNTIYFQMDESTEDAKSSVEKLSDLLRYRLYDHGESMVKIDDEIEYLKSYIEFQKTRKSERLSVKKAFPDGKSDHTIYPFLLLPFIENAFKYVSGDMYIDISLNISDDQMTYTCKNSFKNGKANTNKQGGIGHTNLKRRLEILYPDKHMVDMQYDDRMYTAILKIELN